MASVFVKQVCCFGFEIFLEYVLSLLSQLRFAEGGLS